MSLSFDPSFSPSFFLSFFLCLCISFFHFLLFLPVYLSFVIVRHSTVVSDIGNSYSCPFIVFVDSVKSLVKSRNSIKLYLRTRAREVLSKG